jgi:hypothetical protein
MNDEVQSEEIFSKIENKFHVSCRILFVSEYIFLSWHEALLFISLRCLYQYHRSFIHLMFVKSEKREDPAMFPGKS